MAAGGGGFGALRGRDGGSCQARRARDGLRPGDGAAHLRGAGLLLAHGVRGGLAGHACAGHAASGGVSRALGSCDRCELALLLPRAVARGREPCGAIDKSSTALTVLLAIALFGETEGLPLKLAGTALLLVGTLLMAAGEKNGACPDGVPCDRRWALFAVLSAVFAALTSILAKVGVEGVESNLATALRTGVVLVMAWAIVLARGKQRQLRGIDRREAAFIALSGVATGASWLCYYYAIQNGPVSVVVPIDRLSILVTVAFSVLVLRERLGRRELGGLTLLVVGTLAIAAA